MAIFYSRWDIQVVVKFSGSESLKINEEPCTTNQELRWRAILNLRSGRCLFTIIGISHNGTTLIAI